MSTGPTASDPPWGEPSSRTVTWHDPVASARVGRTLSGLEHPGAIRDGTLPPAPIAALFSMPFSEGVVTDAAGMVVATATSTPLVFDLPG